MTLKRFKSKKQRSMLDESELLRWYRGCTINKEEGIIVFTIQVIVRDHDQRIRFYSRGFKMISVLTLESLGEVHCL